METTINGNLFFQEGICAKQTHARSFYPYTESLEQVFVDYNIYTTARGKNRKRFKSEERLAVGIHAKMEEYSLFLKGNHFHIMGGL